MSKIKGFIGETIIYGFANVFSRAFAMLLIPLYATYLGKIEYSNLIMLQSIFTVLSFLLVLNSGVFYYYYEYENIKYRKMIFTSWFYYQLTIGTILAFGLFMFSDQLIELLIVTPENAEDLRLGMSLIGLQYFPYIFNITNINLYRIDRSPKNVLMITLLEALFTLLFVGGGLMYFEFSIPQVIGAQIAARIIVSFIYIFKARFYLNITYFSGQLLKKLVDFAWPFFIISGFAWVITSIDKFIGAEALTNKEDVAILALSMQLCIPIIVLASMIRMALGPYVMSIRHNKEADKEYQQIFDLTIFSGLVVLVLIVMCTPLLISVLANETYMGAITVVPLIAFASVISLMSNQFSVSFSLSKKNVYILWATVLGGGSGVLINLLLMKDYGYVVAGYSQICSYFLMAVALYFIGKRKTKLNLRLKNSLLLIGITILFMVLVFVETDNVLEGEFLFLVFYGGITLLLLLISYLYLQKISINKLLKRS